MNYFLNLFITFTTIYNFLCYTTAGIFPNSNAKIAPINTNKMPLTEPDINPLVQHIFRAQVLNFIPTPYCALS